MYPSRLARRNVLARGSGKLLAAAAAMLPGTAIGQTMPDHDMTGHLRHATPAQTMSTEPAKQPAGPHAGVHHGPSAARQATTQGQDAASTAGHAPAAHGVMSGMHHDGMGAHAMSGALGAYAMTRDASGTAWQPDTAPMAAIMGTAGDWSTMIHGFVTLIHDDQGGPRGGRKTFSTSMLMGMAQRAIGGGTLTLRAMGSLDALMGKRGYPLLLATGETADGRTELVDRQHPHDAFMELAAAYNRPIGRDLSAFVYLGLPGEPALGPATYMHRFSGMASPEAPIAHHWLDSTHVTFGVATAGVAYRGMKLEASLFTGREPDERRWNIERPRMDSWSVRATVNPARNVSAQLSHGFLKSPEALHPQENLRRTTASITWNLPLGTDRLWQTTLAWGRNDPSGRRDATDAILLESAVQLGSWTAFGRAETVEKDELFGDDHGGDPLAGRVFRVGKLSLGGYHSLSIGRLALDLGGLASTYGLPRAIQPRYGAGPVSVMVFTRLRIAG